MSDYDLQIMVAVVFACCLFGGFMVLYAQDPYIGYYDESIFTNVNETIAAEEGDDPTLLDWIFGLIGLEDEKEALDNTIAAIGKVFELLDHFDETEIWIVGIFTSAMGIIAVIIVARFARGQ